MLSSCDIAGMSQHQTQATYCALSSAMNTQNVPQMYHGVNHHDYNQDYQDEKMEIVIELGSSSLLNAKLQQHNRNVSNQAIFQCPHQQGHSDSIASSSGNYVSTIQNEEDNNNVHIPVHVPSHRQNEGINISSISLNGEETKIYDNNDNTKNNTTNTNTAAVTQRNFETLDKGLADFDLDIAVFPAKMIKSSEDESFLHLSYQY